MSQKQIKRQISALTPVFTTEAGRCLTLANWQEVGIKAGSYYLDALLMKPGMACLKQFAALSNYTGWQGISVLNITLPAARKGVYTLRSSYDGSCIVIDHDSLFSLISLLQPTRVILPQKIVNNQLQAWQALADTSMLFTPVDDGDLQVYPDWLLGRYVHYDHTRPFANFIQQLKQYANLPLYVAGEFEREQLLALTGYNVWHVESDKPAKEAMKGEVYSEEGRINLFDSQRADQHQPIDPNCCCPTCKQSLTKAYLHHLLVHTPLLCQRFLIQHNVYYYQKQLEISRPTS